MSRRGKTQELNGLRALIDELYARLNRAGEVASETLYSVVLRPGDTSGAPNVFASWAALYAKCSSIQGGVRVFVDDSIETPVHMTAGGPYVLNGWRFEGAASFLDADAIAALQIDDGAHWDGTHDTVVTFVDCDISSPATTDVCVVEPDVEFNLNLDSTHIAMTGAGALLNVSDVGDGGFAVAFIENFSLLGDGTHLVINAPGGLGFATIDAETGSHIKAGAINAGVISFDNSIECNIAASGSITLLQQGLQQNREVAGANLTPAAATQTITTPDLVALRTGLFNVWAQMTPTPEALTTVQVLTGVLLLDGVQIAATPVVQSAAFDVGIPTAPMTILWQVQLPDRNPHTIGFQVSIGGGAGNTFVASSSPPSFSAMIVAQELGV